MASLAFHLMVRVARWRRSRFAACLPRMSQPVPGPSREVPASLVSFCGQRDFPELVASWRSFQRWIGRPRRAVVVSDGSLTPAEGQLLRTLEPRTELVGWADFLGPSTGPRLRAYASGQPLGKKLLAVRSIEAITPCLFADSDILFFRGASEMGLEGFWARSTPAFLLDPYPSLDQRYIRCAEEQTPAVNSGLIAMPRALVWEEVATRLETLAGEPTYFTEQTMIHLAVRASGGCPLDPDRYLLRNEDQWAATDWFVRRDTAVRHYISSIRHKMWMHAH